MPQILAAAAAAAGTTSPSTKPTPVKVYLPQRPDEPLLFSLFATNTVHDLVQLAARALELPASDCALKHIDPLVSVCLVICVSSIRDLLCVVTITALFV